MTEITHYLLDGLDLSLKFDPDTGEINVELNTAVGEVDRLLAYYVVIEVTGSTLNPVNGLN